MYDDFLAPETHMFCISCGSKNPDEARFCKKCGVAGMAAPQKAAAAAVAAEPVNTPQPPAAAAVLRPASLPRPATPPQPARTSFDADTFFASFALGLGSIILALIVAGIGYHLVQAQTQACVAGESSCYGTGYWGLFVLAFAIASGGLKMASRIGKK